MSWFWKKPKPRNFYFDPQRDITAYELAIITRAGAARYGLIPIYADQAMAPEFKRHFKAVDEYEPYINVGAAT